MFLQKNRGTVSHTVRPLLTYMVVDLGDSTPPHPTPPPFQKFCQKHSYTSTHVERGATIYLFKEYQQNHLRLHTNITQMSPALWASFLGRFNRPELQRKLQ